ncbi:MAG: glutamyl-tRNA amidotransferase [Phascolarctobacterium sp.]
MSNKVFRYNVNLVPLSIKNKEQNAFRDELNNIPYLLYEVETLSNGERIAINKPGGKRNFGRLSRDDFMVFIFNPDKQSLWLISHGEISDDIANKYNYDNRQALKLIEGLYCVCCGDEPDDVLCRLRLRDTIGIPVETILKVYKWIWGQEDCNYPTKEGRWLSMNALLERFDVSVEEFK